MTIYQLSVYQQKEECVSISAHATIYIDCS